MLDYHRTHETNYPAFDANVDNFAFSRTPPEQPADGVTFVTEPLEPFVERLRAKPGKRIWMMGGAGLIASFLDAGHLDEFDIHVIPVLIGEGIPLVAPRHRDIQLNLRHSQTYADGVVRLQYEVQR